MLDRHNDLTLDSFALRYDLPPQEISALTTKLLSLHAHSVPNNCRYIAVEVKGDTEYSNIGRYVERVVFEEEFGNDVKQMSEEYGPYEAASNFFISLDRESGKPIGVLRLIRNSRAGFKTLNDARHEPFNVCLKDAVEQHRIVDLDKLLDIGTFAVLSEYRAGRGLSGILLFRAMYKASLARGTEHWVSIIDDKVLQALKIYLSMPFVPLAGSKPGPYLGSKKSHAVYAYVPDLFEIMGDGTNPSGGHIMGRIFNSSSMDSKTILLPDEFEKTTQNEGA